MGDDLSTVAAALAWATELLRPMSATPRLDAELLLAHALGWSRARVLAEGRQALSEAQQGAFRNLAGRRAALEPVAYLLGRKEFYGLDFVVDQRVLVPRPETELLVDLAIAYARRPTTDDGPPAAISRRWSVVGGRSSVTIADIGTGSGAIAVALAVALPSALVYATDISPTALELARLNAARHGVDRRVQLLEGDLLDPLPEPVGLIVSNPPYTVLAEIDEGVRRHEPHLALDGGRDGLDAYRRLLAQAPEKLRPGGALLLEIGATQAAAVSDLARAQFPRARIAIYQDLAGLDRVVAIETAGDVG